MSGRPDYDVGDLVVCITGPGSPKWSGTLRTGAVYRVSRLKEFPDDWGVLVEGAACPWEDGYYTGNFRKVDRLPDALTSLLASKPREQVPA